MKTIDKQYQDLSRIFLNMGYKKLAKYVLQDKSDIMIVSYIKLILVITNDYHVLQKLIENNLLSFKEIEMLETESSKYIDHLLHIGRKYFTRPPDEPPTSEMTFFEKCKLSGYLYKESFNGEEPEPGFINSNAVTKMLISGEEKDEKEFLESIKRDFINSYEKIIQEKLSNRIMEIENARLNQQASENV